MDLTTTSHYDRKTATVRPKEGTTREGQAYLYVSDAQLEAAASRALAVSGDHMTLPEVEGYSEWQTVEGGMACYRLECPAAIHYYETPDDPCRAVCASCASQER